MLSRPNAASRLTKIPNHYVLEATRLLPELSHQAHLSDPQPPIVSSRTRLFESLRQILLELLSGLQTGILFIDDLQWIDSASLDFLTYLVRRLQDYPIFIVATWRNEGDLSRLVGLLTESQRAGLGTKINLERLTLTDVEQLAANVASVPTDRLQTNSWRGLMAMLC